MYVLVVVYREVIVVKMNCVGGDGGVVRELTRHTDTEMDIILKHLLMVALRLQLRHHSLSPIRLSIIYVNDFMGFSRYICLY